MQVQRLQESTWIFWATIAFLVVSTANGTPEDIIKIHVAVKITLGFARCHEVCFKDSPFMTSAGPCTAKVGSGERIRAHGSESY